MLAEKLIVPELVTGGFCASGSILSLSEEQEAMRMANAEKAYSFMYFIVYSDLSFTMRCVLRSPVLQVHHCHQPE
jgi:hypothetical protein